MNGASHLGKAEDMSFHLAFSSGKTIQEFRDVDGNECYFDQYLSSNRLYASKCVLYIVSTPLTQSTETPVGHNNAMSGDAGLKKFATDKSQNSSEQNSKKHKWEEHFLEEALIGNINEGMPGEDVGATSRQWSDVMVKTEDENVSESIPVEHPKGTSGQCSESTDSMVQTAGYNISESRPAQDQKKTSGHCSETTHFMEQTVDDNISEHGPAEDQKGTSRHCTETADGMVQTLDDNISESGAAEDQGATGGQCPESTEIVRKFIALQGDSELPTNEIDIKYVFTKESRYSKLPVTASLATKNDCYHYLALTDPDIYESDLHNFHPLENGFQICSVESGTFRIVSNTTLINF